MPNSSITSQSAKLLDYAGVNRYWSNAESSILGPYMMDGFGFPAGAGQFRFQAECRIVNRLIQGINCRSVLDLGCGNGYWAEYFARRFTKVIAVEASESLFNVMAKRCAGYTNVTPTHADALSFEPEEEFSLAFLGGMLMYLNESDVISLLRKLAPFIEKGGAILCRETTIRQGEAIRNGAYQAAYRSVQTYTNIFEQCGLATVQVEANSPYILLQMGCESIKKWKENIPTPLQAIPAVGRMAYWGLRLCDPWILRLPVFSGRNFPELTNHFFLLHPASQENPGK